MAEEKNSPPEPQPLAPYAHELNPDGTDCAEDCPACRLVDRTQDAPWPRLVSNG
jgi:hypothetical protein